MYTFRGKEEKEKKSGGGYNVVILGGNVPFPL
jgi:hypothetical protein